MQRELEEEGAVQPVTALHCRARCTAAARGHNVYPMPVVCVRAALAGQAVLPGARVLALELARGPASVTSTQTRVLLACSPTTETYGVSDALQLCQQMPAFDFADC